MEPLSGDWLTRAQHGDAEAFAGAFEALRPVVFAVAARLVGPDDAEDVTMETFLRAWQAVNQFNDIVHTAPGKLYELLIKGVTDGCIKAILY